MELTVEAMSVSVPEVLANHFCPYCKKDKADSSN
jgi:glutaredoxin